MKVIDLLNKIANGEEVPKKIKYNDKIWRLASDGTYFIGSDYGYDFWLEHGDDKFEDEPITLNDEVEIIEEKEICHKCHKYPAEYNQTYCEFCLGISKLEEEKKIPEKLNLDIDELRGKETPRAIDYLIESKINQVIDYLKSKGE